MRALMTASKPDTEVELVHLPDPRPGEGQLRIKMVGAGVNAADLHIIDGSGREFVDGDAARQLGLGLDVAGVVDLVGAGVEGFATGDRVAAFLVPHAPYAVAGAAAEYVIVPAADAALLAGDALASVRDHGAYLGVFPGREPAAERGITVEAGVVTPDGALLREMLVLTARGILESRRAGTLPLADAAEAYRAPRAGGQRGRWVLTP